MKIFAILIGFVVVASLLGLVAMRVLSGHRPVEDGLALTSAIPEPPPPPSPVVPEQGSHFEVVRPKVDPLPPTVAEPLFDPDARIKIGETANLKFAATDRVSGKPVSGAVVTATVSRAGGPPAPLKAEEVEDGVFQVAFTPTGPGQFEIGLNVDGVPAGSRKVGVVGVAGDPKGKVDVIDPLSIDPREWRARTAGRGRLR